MGKRITVYISRFVTNVGTEFFITLEPPTGLTFIDTSHELYKAYEELLRQNDLNIDTEIFVRFYLSDITNQAEALRRILRQRKATTFYPIIGQPPASGSKIALEAYHIKSKLPIKKKMASENILCVHHGKYRSLWIRNLPRTASSPYKQTKQLFSDLSKTVAKYNVKIRDCLMRTWVYVRNIDDNYQDMVNARHDFFREIGLNRRSHYAASTGIGGEGENIKHDVIIDSFSVSGLMRGQVKYLSAPRYMNSPREYGVTFERGLRITYGDRSHFYISGTASIDNKGQTLYVNDIKKQTRRTITNIQALLRASGADLNDMKIIKVYLRNISDAPGVIAVIKETFPKGLPYSILCGSICRPLWLVEIEGVAVSSLKDEKFTTFC